ncbi:hypothetical protein AAES_150685 [Amazona aestiva]|uniref:Uncharacterized protein n=1 Tax=Amazona aestiva TaxID=12930 RepID=A0A0Q3UQV4_AMAAE|nr:hypothetical protein AAES_150685 [Amazona aestiva]
MDEFGGRWDVPSKVMTLRQASPQELTFRVTLPDQAVSMRIRSSKGSRTGAPFPQCKFQGSISLQKLPDPQGQPSSELVQPGNDAFAVSGCHRANLETELGLLMKTNEISPFQSYETLDQGRTRQGQEQLPEQPELHDLGPGSKLQHPK